MIPATKSFVSSPTAKTIGTNTWDILYSEQISNPQQACWQIQTAKECGRLIRACGTCFYSMFK